MIARRLALFVFVALVACRGEATRDPDARGDAAAHARRIEQLVVGLDFACVRLRGGEVRCWGANHHAQLGDGTQRVREHPQPVVDLDDAIHLAVGPGNACAVRRSGAVVCWGRRSPGPEPEVVRRPTAIAGLPKARTVAISRGRGHVLTAGGEVWTFELTGPAKPKKVPVIDVVELVAGSGNVCARTRNDVRCWSDTPRDCGPNAISCTPAPGSELGIVDVVELAMQSDRLCARKADGTVWCTRTDRHCSVVEDDFTDVRPRRVAELAHATGLIGTSCAKVEDGTLWCWGDSPLRAGGEDGCRASPALLAGFSKAQLIAGSASVGCVAIADELSCWSQSEGRWGGESVAVGATYWTRIEGLAAPAQTGVPPLETWMAKLVKRPVSGYAYVWNNAPWYAKPGADAVGQIASFADDQRFETHAARTPVRILADLGELVEVRTLADGGFHCDGGASVLADYDLRAFVRKRDLVPVLAEPYSVGFSDGTGVTLSAGLVVRPTEDGVVVDRMGALPIEARERDVGLSYPSVSTVPEYRRGTGVLAEDTELKLDGKRIARADWRLESFTMVSHSETSAGSLLVQLAARCVTVRVQVAKGAVQSGGGGGGVGGIGTIGGGFTRRPREWSIPASVRAYWPDGSAAGVTYRRRSTLRAPTTIAGRLCFPFGELRVCHDAGDVTSTQ